jgi:hypothetical protein
MSSLEWNCLAPEMTGLVMWDMHIVDETYKNMWISSRSSLAMTLPLTRLPPIAIWSVILSSGGRKAVARQFALTGREKKRR